MGRATGRPTLQQQADHPFLQHELRARQLTYEVKRLEKNAALEEHNFKDRFGFKPRSLQMEQLLDKAGELEDAGQYGAAVKLYQKALAMEPEHHELRKHIATVDLRLNAMASVEKQACRQEAYDIKLAGEGDKATLRVQSALTNLEEVRGKARQGCAVLSPAEQGRILKAQAREDAALREARRKQERMLEQQVVDIANAALAREKHRQDVHVANCKLQFQNDTQEAIEQRKEARMRRFLQEMEAHPSGAAASPLLGMGEHDLRQAAAQLQRRTKAWHLEQQRVKQAPASIPTSHAGKQLYAGVVAPYSRPDVDYPVPALQAGDVRRRQQEWQDKHRKREQPVRLGQQHVTPQNHQRPVDWNGYRAVKVTAQQQRQ